MAKISVRATHDDISRRLVAKIAFNLLAHLLGARFALKEEFDAIRLFIRYGQGVGSDFVCVEDRPVSSPPTIIRNGSFGPSSCGQDAASDPKVNVFSVLQERRLRHSNQTPICRFMYIKVILFITCRQKIYSQEKANNYKVIGILPQDFVADSILRKRALERTISPGWLHTNSNRCRDAQAGPDRSARIARRRSRGLPKSFALSTGCRPTCHRERHSAYGSPRTATPSSRLGAGEMPTESACIGCLQARSLGSYVPWLVMSSTTTSELLPFLASLSNATNT